MNYIPQNVNRRVDRKGGRKEERRAGWKGRWGEEEREEVMEEGNFPGATVKFVPERISSLVKKMLYMKGRHSYRCTKLTLKYRHSGAGG